MTITEDAALDRFDTALLISADSDLCPAIRATKRIDPTKRMIVAFPPKRQSYELEATADAVIRIGATKLRQSQLPQVVVANGIELHRPAHWA